MFLSTDLTPEWEQLEKVELLFTQEALICRSFLMAVGTRREGTWPLEACKKDRARIEH